VRFFNVSGPCDPRFHYMLPAVERLPEAPRLVDRGAYFVVHAPRQTGKTTTLRALARELTVQGKYVALHFTCEVGAAAEDDLVMAQRLILTSIRMAATLELPRELRPPTPWPGDPAIDGPQLLGLGLLAWAQACPRPLVLFFDEIDALRGPSLMVVLSQLRAGYSTRPDGAPWAAALCGLRDVRDYKAASGGDPGRLGSSSPFNIKDESMRLGDFTRAELGALYAQHTQETGQAFTDEALERAFALTQGQPWLVNALAREIMDKMRILPPAPITAEHMEEAKERLILARATHLDSLVAKLHEDRVSRIIEPLLAGGHVDADMTYNDDVSYVRDLGLIAITRPLRIANPIYREVIARVLSAVVEDHVTVPPSHFVAPDGRLDLRRILEGFARFWQEHGAALAGTMPYHEVAQQLVLMAFLQSIVNGTGFLDREYGVGRGRIDLQLRWPYADEHGRRQWQREAFELKVWRDKKADPRDEGLAQLDAYLDQLGLDHGVLVIFDRRTDPRAGATPPGERTRFEDTSTPAGRPVTVLCA
jgi:hypothetical protein